MRGGGETCAFTGLNDQDESPVISVSKSRTNLEGELHFQCSAAHQDRLLRVKRHETGEKASAYVPLHGEQMNGRAQWFFWDAQGDREDVCHGTEKNSAVSQRGTSNACSTMPFGTEAAASALERCSKRCRRRL